MRRILVIIFLFSLLINKSKAQDFPTISQYIANGLIINPAYSGSREVLSLSMLYRNQYAFSNGAPVYDNISANAPLRNAHIGIGMFAENQQTGAFRYTRVYFNYAYRINIRRGKLSLGLKGGFDFIAHNNSVGYLNNPNDPPFLGIPSTISPNVGLGIYYYSRRAFIGFSIPYILSFKNYNQIPSGLTNNKDNYEYLISAGYLLTISHNFKIRPSTLIQYNKIYQKQANMNLNFIFFDNKLSFGAGYRMNDQASKTSDAVFGMVEIQYNPQLRFGYSYDYSGNSTLTNAVCHEISIRYEFSYKIKALSPRYF